MWMMIRKNQISIMRLNNRLAKCQSKSQASLTVCNRIFPGVKHLKYMRFHFFGEKNPLLIPHATADPTIPPNTASFPNALAKILPNIGKI